MGPLTWKKLGNLPLLGEGNVAVDVGKIIISLAGA